MLEDELCARAMLSRMRNEPVDWREMQEAILKKAEKNVGEMEETYLKDALLCVSPNETGIVPVLYDDLVLRPDSVAEKLG